MFDYDISYIHILFGLNEGIINISISVNGMISHRFK